jgi:LysM repeat protein
LLRKELVIQRIVRLTLIGLFLLLALVALPLAASATSATPSTSHLPATQPGLSPDEGTFLVTAGDDGNRLIYFIAGNTRHSIVLADWQHEMQLNPLWPVRAVDRDEVVGFPEGAPVGTAPTGGLDSPVAADDTAAEAPESDSAADASTTSYVVKPGDSAIRIAREFGIDENALLQANAIANPNRVYVGQTLVIPTGAPVAVADDQSQPDATADDNANADAVATIYVVRPGDSAIRIARQFGIEEEALLQANAIANPNRVYVGQTLTIPSGDS